MSEPRPSDFEQLVAWMAKEDIAFMRIPDERIKYEGLRDDIAEKLVDDPNWLYLQAALREANAEYRETEKIPLFRDGKTPDPLINKKKWGSFSRKVWRKNCEKWDAPPLEGGDWITNENWWEHIRDVVRTQVRVTYLDGVSFLLERLAGASFGPLEFPEEPEYKATRDGYYAAHLIASYSYEGSPDVVESPVSMRVPIEIQVTTELKGGLKDLLHMVYEWGRDDFFREEDNDEEATSWRYESLPFKTRYLGHAAQFFEGVIVDTRRKIVRERGVNGD